MDARFRTPNLAAIMERQRKAWASGNYSKQGAHFAIIAELLCEAVDLRPTRRVLDVATGNGNAALAAARRFCDVTGVDHAPAPLAWIIHARPERAARSSQSTCPG